LFRIFFFLLSQKRYSIVLLLDEPFNALDDEHFELMIKTIKELKKDTLIIVAAHGFDTEKHPIFDEIITLNSGKIV